MKNGFEIAVIGGGPGGYVAAIKAAQLGAKVVLFEKDTVGGTCLNRGCIPTKTYVKTAEYIKHLKHAEHRGIHIDTSTLAVDLPAIVAQKDEVVKKLTSGVAGLLESYGVTVIKGLASLTKERRISCAGEIYDVPKIILAGGSKPALPGIPGIADSDVLTSNEILDLKEIPKRLVIIGGGVIGCEIATAFAAFGSEVTIVEAANQLVVSMGKDIYKHFRKSIKAQGIKTLLKVAVAAIDRDENGHLIVKTADQKTLAADKVLIATGRCAELACLGEMRDDFEMVRNYVAVDEQMRTSIANIYCVGDMNGQGNLAHTAFKMGESAAINALGGNECVDLRFIPNCLYTLPEAASVGLTEETAKKDYDIAVGSFSFSANGRALGSSETEGFVKVIIDKQYGEILGVQILGAAATEMISEATMCMSMEITAHEVADTIHPHPTYSEAFMEACADALGKCIHLPKK
ncbi:dihydrolipoyl dehydrogenase [Acetobacterium woodii]|uniref:Dihydrolipoyl dehydrogenase n=1 Tax=Acetobacterium woodii (strain ATCC 29683 / DSM 1030 / JCM 2381 / KCTC 1655 / WB1) TaxID=931626 RepID=H6LHG4_ACEWD|nr:dihydrolipoyl dehydrogenase [Acetobacterium woodii]AFA49674.1 TPP-dependent acetoin dehydrogenase complex E3 component dihydrolipoamide dehydrogenase AcoL2 [Acetobacterium woodii DSM 1030]